MAISTASQTTLTTEVLRRLGDASAGTWSESEIQSLLDEGYRDAIARSRAAWYYTSAAQSTATKTLTNSSTLSYLDFDAVIFDDDVLRPLSSAELERMLPTFQSDTGDPLYYLREGDGWDVIRLVPAPSSSATLVLEGLRCYRSSTSYVDLQARYAPILRWYALWKCLEREGDYQDLALADHYQARYKAGVTRLRERVERLNSARIGQLGSVFGRGDRARRPRWPYYYGSDEA